MATTVKWFPHGTNGNDQGWRLDIVSLLAVIGESSMESHSQALTSSWTCILPRIIPAPQALLKPSRPTRMPQINAAVVGVHNGTLVPTLNYFPNIIHPIEELPAFSFRVLHITHRKSLEPLPPPRVTRGEKVEKSSSSTGTDIGVLEAGLAPRVPTRRATINHIARVVTGKEKKPRVPPKKFSPLNILTVSSFFVTIGLVVAAAIEKDGTALIALGTISLASSIVGYASWWQPVLMKRLMNSKVPAGDVIIRTREGAFLLVKCDEDVARELYTGTDECQYYVGTQKYRILVGFGTFLLMVSVVLLGNCNFNMQAAIGLSYIILNGTYWGASLIPKKAFWDLSNYECVDITPEDAKSADKTQGPANVQHGHTLEEVPSFTRTMWYAIRETKKIGWVNRGGVAPKTDKWDRWLKQAEENAVDNNRTWDAVKMREQIVGQAETVPPQDVDVDRKDNAEEHVPAIEVPPPEKR
jgi:hypothetical protein